MANVCLCPPDIVPTGWAGSDILIPIFPISEIVISSIFLKLRIPNGPGPFFNSFPRKKFLVTEVSALSAKSW